MSCRQSQGLGAVKDVKVKRPSKISVLDGLFTFMLLLKTVLYMKYATYFFFFIRLIRLPAPPNGR